MTDAEPPTSTGANGSAPGGSPNGSPRGKQPSVRYPPKTRLAIVVVLAIGIGALVVAGLTTQTGDDDGQLAVTGTDADADTGAGAGADADAGAGADAGATASTVANGVEARSPGRGAEALAQDAIEIDLASGWTGEAMTLEPRAGDAIVVPDDQLAVTELDAVRFTPGPDQVIERLPSGPLCVRVTIWNQIEGRPATERVESWCFDVT